MASFNMSSDHEKVSSSGHHHPNTSLSWSQIEFKAKSKTLIQGISGNVRGGEMIAILGPSGAGKSTLLDVLAGRKQASSGSVTLDNCHTTASDVFKASSYVEQDDALLGVLSVRETVEFSARLSQLDSNLSRKELKELSDETITSLGLSQVAGNHVGTSISRGISGGQRRRLTVANSFVSLPKVLFLDEPVSGLDSYTAYEVMAALQRVVRKRNIAVIATIHSPTWETFSLFDRVLLLAGGKTMYYGTPTGVRPYFESLGHSTPENSNPADHMMTLVNGDFSHLQSEHSAEAHDGQSRAMVEKGDTGGFGQHWQTNDPTSSLAPTQNYEPCVRAEKKTTLLRMVRNDSMRTGILIERNLLNYSRNLLAFGVRFGMYLGMGLMLATIWIRLPQTDASINDRLSVLFYAVAFLGFMSVAGIPAFLEERAVYVRERKNNLYGPFAYVLAQTLCNLPFLFMCTLVFSLICYWAIGLHPGPTAFFRFLAYVYLGVAAAEMQSLLIAAILPIFVAALAVAAFVNGFWMSVQGYFIRNLPHFWKVSFHWMDYETYAFQILVKSDLTGLIFPCAGSIAANDCFCSVPSSLISQGTCAVAGEDVIASLGYNGSSGVLYAFILVFIILFYRICFYVVLKLTI